MDYAFIVTCPLVTFFMLKPTVGIESSLNSPAARTFNSVVLPLFWRPINVIFPKSAQYLSEETTSISVRQKSSRSQSRKEDHQDIVRDG